MAEIKSCEQYVVAKLEMTELLLEQERDNHARDVLELTEELKKTRSILADAENLIEFIRSKFSLTESSYSGQYISVDNIYAGYDEEDFNRLVAELGLELPKKDEETEDA